MQLPLQDPNAIIRPQIAEDIEDISDPFDSSAATFKEDFEAGKEHDSEHMDDSQPHGRPMRDIDSWRGGFKVFADSIPEVKANYYHGLVTGIAEKEWRDSGQCANNGRQILGNAVPLGSLGDCQDHIAQHLEPRLRVQAAAVSEYPYKTIMLVQFPRNQREEVLGAEDRRMLLSCKWEAEAGSEPIMALVPVSCAKFFVEIKSVGQRSLGFGDVAMGFATTHFGVQQSKSSPLYILAVAYSTQPVSLELRAATCYAPILSPARATGGTADKPKRPGQRKKQPEVPYKSVNNGNK